jgi:hypothetical protein
MLLLSELFPKSVQERELTAAAVGEAGAEGWGYLPPGQQAGSRGVGERQGVSCLFWNLCFLHYPSPWLKTLERGTGWRVERDRHLGRVTCAGSHPLKSACTHTHTTNSPRSCTPSAGALHHCFLFQLKLEYF